MHWPYRCGANYHVQLSEDHRYYSAPYIHGGKKVKVLYDQRTVEIYPDNQRIPLHMASLTVVMNWGVRKIKHTHQHLQSQNPLNHRYYH